MYVYYLIRNYLFTVKTRIPLKRAYLFDVCSENKGCCGPTKSTVLFPICRIGPRSSLKLLKELEDD